MRIAPLVVAVCALVTLAGSARSSAGPPPIVARSIYVVRPDPRLCPSPLCGGYWVSLANHARTRCSDGLRRPRCYVALAIDAGTRQPITLPGNALAKGVLGSKEFGALGKLGTLTVVQSWAPAGQSPATGRFFRIRDTGIRCIRAPCFTLRVGRLNTATRTSLVSGLDLGPARSGKARQRAEAALGTPDGLLVAGRITATADGGRLLRATQVYLTEPQPRA